MNPAEEELLASEAIRNRAEAALSLIKAGWEDRTVAIAVGLPSLNDEGK